MPPEAAVTLSLPSAPPDRSPPHSAEAEEHVLACCLIDEGSTLDRCLEAGLTPESFYARPSNRLLFEILLEMRAGQKQITLEVLAEELKTRRQLEAIGGFPYLMQVTGKIPTTTAHAGYFIEKVREKETLRSFIKRGMSVVERCYGFTGGLEELADEIGTEWTALVGDVRGASLDDRLQERRFDFTSPPPEPVARFMVNGRPVCTPGNITNLIAQSKVGKSAFVGAFIAAAVGTEAGDPDRDTLGVTASALNGRQLLHVDTEQAPYDHDQLIRLALRRAGVDRAPAWLKSYALAGFPAADLRNTIRRILKAAHKKGGVFALIIDGVADLVNNVNDPEECNPFVSELHALAIEHDCSVINVIHENPGADGGKGRGHLGSQLERKAESNIRLRKLDEVTTVFSEKMRRAPILEKDGPRFRWDVEAGMHVSVATLGVTRESARAAELRELAADVFEGRVSMRYSDLLEALEKTRKCSVRTAERIFGELKKHAIIERYPPNLWNIKS